MLEEIRNLVKDSQNSREKRNKRETIKLKTPYGAYSKTAGSINRPSDSRTLAEVHESRRRLYHSHTEIKGESLNLASVDHQLRKYAFEMGDNYRKLNQTERRIKKSLEHFIPSMSKVDTYVELSKSQSISVSNAGRKIRQFPTKKSSENSKPPTPQQSLADLAATSSKSVNFHITSTRLKRKYPQYCEELSFSEEDVKQLSCKRDHWIVKFMEICYDEALDAMGASTTHGKKRLRHGLDTGGLDSFPSLVQRAIAKQFSTLDFRMKTSLEVLYTIEYLIQTAEISRYKMKFDEAKVIFDGGRALLFSRFLTEEYDVDVLAAFLFCRELVQKELGQKLKDMNPIRMNLTEKILELKPTFNMLIDQNLTSTATPAKLPTKISKLQSRLPPRSSASSVSEKSLPPAPSGLLPSPSSAKDESYQLAWEFRSQSESASMPDCRVVPNKLPEKWSYVDDIIFPETPLVAFEKSNLMHLCFVVASKTDESARQYMCRRIKDLAVNDMIREGSFESRAVILTHIHIYAFLRTVCSEWKKISAEDKGQFTDSGSLLTNLSSLNEIYDKNCELIKQTAEKVIVTEGEVGLASARVSRLEKQLKREGRKFDSRIAGQEELDNITRLKEELAVARIERRDLEESLVLLKRDKEHLQQKIEKLWTNIMEQNRSIKFYNSSDAGSYWKQFVSFMLNSTLRENAKNFAISQQSLANSKSTVQNALMGTIKSSSSTITTLADSQSLPSSGPTDAEVRESLIEALARIVARNAINDGKRKYLLHDFLQQKRFDLLLKYGDEEARRKQDERLRKAREERIRQNRLRMTAFMVKTMTPSLVQQVVDTGKSKAAQALYDPWWMLDLDPQKIVSSVVLELVERKFVTSRLRRRWALLRFLFRKLAWPIYVKRITTAHQRWIPWRSLRKWHHLNSLHESSKILTRRVQKLVRCFLFKCRLHHHLQRLDRANISADWQHLKYRMTKRYPRMLQYLHLYGTLRRRYHETRVALKERRFLICFYTWLDKFKKLQLHKMQQSKKHNVAAICVQCCIRSFLARRRVQKKRALRVVQSAFRRAVARFRFLRMRTYRRRESEVSEYLRYRNEKFVQKQSLLLWLRCTRILKGCRTVASAYVQDKLRKRFHVWSSFTEAKNAYLSTFVVKIQSIFHKAVVFRRFWHFYRWRRAFVKLQGMVRRYQALRRFEYDIYYYRQARTIQRYSRGYIIRKTIDTRRLGDVMYAAANNKYERLKFYVDYRPDLVSKIDRVGNTALHYAAQNAAKRTLKLLMRFGLQPNVLNNDGLSPLHLLIMSSAIHRDECFVYMIERGFDEDQLTSMGKTCLLLAAERGHIVIAKRLLEDGHDPNVADNEGFSCLQAACLAGSPPVVRELLENDAEVNRVGRNSTYPIHESVSGGNIDVLNLLLTYKAEVNVFESNYYQTPLMWASQLGHGNIARQLILYGAEVNERDFAGKTAAHYAAMTNTTDIYHALREAEANFDITDNEGNTPLHMAAYYNAFSFAKEVLQGGSYPSFQNDQGDQPAHIAARYNQVDMLKVIAQYDEHIGRCNYSHQTPLGVAKFYGANECQQFLEHHYFMVESVDGRNAVGEIWWDKAIDSTLLEWDVQVQSNGDRRYVNRKTGEVSDRPPAMAADTVKQIAEKAELPVQRAVTLVKEGTALTKHAYYLDYQVQKQEIKEMNKDYRNATVIVKWARRKLAYMELRRLKAQKKRNKTILRFLRRHLPGFMRYRNELKRLAARRIQAGWRGYVARKRFFDPNTGDFWAKRRVLAHRRLRYDLWQLWQAYKRKMAFRALLLIAKMPRTLADWAMILDKAKRPVRVMGAYEEWAYPGQRGVFFYRHALTGACEFVKPLKLIIFDDECHAEAIQLKKFGATLKQIALATKLQALWRGYQVRHYSQSIEKALRICQRAEDKYLNAPEVDSNVYNFALYSLTFRQDIERARRLFVESLRRMQWRGPDVAFVLYAYAIFGLITDDEEYADVKKFIVRAHEAEDYHNRLVRAKYLAEENAINFDYTPLGAYADSNAKKGPPLKKKKAEKKAVAKNDTSDLMLLLGDQMNRVAEEEDEDTAFNYGRCFDLAHVGFFQYTASTINNASAWEALAICRFLVYNDFKASFDAFLEAFKFEPKNQRIRAHFDIMMSHFFGHNKEVHDEMTKLRLRHHAQLDADREEMRRIHRDLAKKRWKAASKIKRWYKERRQQRIFTAFLTMVREKIRRQAKAKGRQYDGPSPNTPPQPTPLTPPQQRIQSRR